MPKNILDNKPVMTMIILAALIISVVVFQNYFEHEDNQTELDEKLNGNAEDSAKIVENTKKDSAKLVENIKNDSVKMDEHKKLKNDSIKFEEEKRKTDSVYRAELQQNIKKHISGIEFDLEYTKELIKSADSINKINSGKIDTVGLGLFKEVCKTIKTANKIIDAEKKEDVPSEIKWNIVENLSKYKRMKWTETQTYQLKQFHGITYNICKNSENEETLAGFTKYVNNKKNKVSDLRKQEIIEFIKTRYK